MNYILEVYSHGMFVPITGAVVEKSPVAVTLEFGIDDNFNNPDWMDTNIYKIESRLSSNNRLSESSLNKGNSELKIFLQDAQRDIMAHLDANGFFKAQA